jgi:hypothetical protein
VVVNTLLISGTATFQGDIILQGHFVTNGVAPTPELLQALGVSTADGLIKPEVVVSGNDTLGTITIHTGKLPTSGAVAKIVFAKPFVNAPQVMLSPSNERASQLRFYRGDTTSEHIVINFADAPAENTVYQFDYFIGEAR